MNKVQALHRKCKKHTFSVDLVVQDLLKKIKGIYSNLNLVKFIEFDMILGILGDFILTISMNFLSAVFLKRSMVAGFNKENKSHSIKLIRFKVIVLFLV